MDPNVELDVIFVLVEECRKFIELELPCGAFENPDC